MHRHVLLIYATARYWACPLLMQLAVLNNAHAWRLHAASSLLHVQMSADEQLIGTCWRSTLEN